jgi:hypothetical protein
MESVLAQYGNRAIKSQSQIEKTQIVPRYMATEEFGNNLKKLYFCLKKNVKNG